MFLSMEPITDDISQSAIYSFIFCIGNLIGISLQILWQEIWSGRYIRDIDVLYFRICSVLEEVFYIKGKVHENTIIISSAGQAKEIYLLHVLHISLLRKTKEMSILVQCIVF